MVMMVVVVAVVLVIKKTRRMIWGDGNSGSGDGGDDGDYKLCHFRKCHLQTSTQLFLSGTDAY